MFNTPKKNQTGNALEYLHIITVFVTYIINSNNIIKVKGRNNSRIITFKVHNINIHKNAVFTNQLPSQ